MSDEDSLSIVVAPSPVNNFSESGFGNSTGNGFYVGRGRGFRIMSSMSNSLPSSFGPFPCEDSNKILWRAVKGGDMPSASYADKHTVAVLCGGKHQVLDFTSKVVDFFTICHGDADSEYDNPHNLVVVAEEEIVLIDLESNDWLPFRLPHLPSLHMSFITCIQYCRDVPQDMWNKIVTSGKKQLSGIYTEREWPIMEGDNLFEAPKTHNLLLTGHEDGSVRFWGASGVALPPLYTIHTSQLFVSKAGEAPVEEEEWPPFRKVGSFDPYSDDPRLAIKKILLCPLSKILVVAGSAGQVIFFEIKEEEVEKEMEVHPVNIVSDCDNFVWKGHDQLSLKQGSLKFETGFVPVAVEQLTPPAAVTAIVVHTQWGLVAAETAHGFALFDYVSKKAVMSRCTLNPNGSQYNGTQSSSGQDDSGWDETPSSNNNQNSWNASNSYQVSNNYASRQNTVKKIVWNYLSSSAELNLFVKIWGLIVTCSDEAPVIFFDWTEELQTYVDNANRINNFNAVNAALGPTDIQVYTRHTFRDSLLKTLVIPGVTRVNNSSCFVFEDFGKVLNLTSRSINIAYSKWMQALTGNPPVLLCRIYMCSDTRTITCLDPSGTPNKVW